jgi:prephenate dehydratase
MPTPPQLPAAFTGAPGAYSQEAARRFLGSNHPTLTCGNASDAVAALRAGRAGHAVLPVENSITGGFAGVPEALREADLAIVGEVELAVRHCLLAVPGTRLEDVAVVRSHPTALAQCRDWLAQWGVATRVSGDTAEAARELSRSGEAALAVIGSASLAAMYGLDVLAEGISDRADNRTRFLVFAAAGAPEAPAAFRSAFLVGPVHVPRTFKTLRIKLESRGATRTRAPFLGSEDGTLALVEFDHSPGAGRRVADGACAGLGYRWLGTWTPGPRRSAALPRGKTA